MLLNTLRRLFAPTAPKPCEDLTHTPALVEQCRSDLVRRAPDHLKGALLDAIQSYGDRATNDSELLDAIDQRRVGLGVAIGRGETGENERYDQLGLVVSWLYEELGQPQNTQYAVVMRAAEILRSQEQKHGEA
jgi:hypothetical protein